MSAPSDPQSPPEPTGSRPPSTQEIPVVPAGGATAASKQLPPHPDAVAPAPVPPAPVGAAQPTGPVSFVPGLPGLGTPPVPSAPPAPPVAPATTPGPSVPTPGDPAAGSAPGATPSWPDTLEAGAPATGRARKLRRSPVLRDQKALIGLGLAALAVVLLLLGLTLEFGSSSLWSVVPLWSAFAALCALLALLAFAASHPAGNRLRAGVAWRVAAAGLIGLSVFWLLVVLPVADTDRGFVLTAALACLGGALWIGPRTRA